MVSLGTFIQARTAVRRESQLSFIGDLIVVDTYVVGPTGKAWIELVLDTGSTYTTLVPPIAEMLGLNRRPGSQAVTLRTAAAVEYGYRTELVRMTALGMRATDFAVTVADLGHGIDGLLGMDFLANLNFEVRPAEQRILVELIAR